METTSRARYRIALKPASAPSRTSKTMLSPPNGPRAGARLTRGSTGRVGGRSAPDPVATKCRDRLLPDSHARTPGHSSTLSWPDACSRTLDGPSLPHHATSARNRHHQHHGDSNTIDGYLVGLTEVMQRVISDAPHHRGTARSGRANQASRGLPMQHIATWPNESDRTMTSPASTCRDIRPRLIGATRTTPIDLQSTRNVPAGSVFEVLVSFANYGGRRDTTTVVRQRHRPRAPGRPTGRSDRHQIYAMERTLHAAAQRLRLAPSATRQSLPNREHFWPRGSHRQLFLVQRGMRSVARLAPGHTPTASGAPPTKLAPSTPGDCQVPIHTLAARALRACPTTSGEPRQTVGRQHPASRRPAPLATISPASRASRRSVATMPTCPTQLVRGQATGSACAWTGDWLSHAVSSATSATSATSHADTRSASPPLVSDHAHGWSGIPRRDRAPLLHPPAGRFPPSSPTLDRDSPTKRPRALSPTTTHHQTHP